VDVGFGRGLKPFKTHFGLGDHARCFVTERSVEIDWPGRDEGAGGSRGALTAFTISS
jgi:hypothetical protein